MSKLLLESDVPSDPLVLFEQWLEDVQDAGYFEPGAMNLCSVSADGKPSARMVLFKGLIDDQLTFYTNFNSRKAQELAANPNVALVFWWGHHERQIRVEGSVEKLSAAQSAAYFSSRPIRSQIGAISSPQSQVIESRQWLENEMARNTERFGDEVPAPEFWGGYAVKPAMFEFWQGQRDRLHDRIVYCSDDKNGWLISRLAP